MITMIVLMLKIAMIQQHDGLMEQQLLMRKIAMVQQHAVLHTGTAAASVVAAVLAVAAAAVLAVLCVALLPRRIKAGRCKLHWQQPSLLLLQLLLLLFLLQLPLLLLLLLLLVVVVAAVVVVGYCCCHLLLLLLLLLLLGWQQHGNAVRGYLSGDFYYARSGNDDRMAEKGTTELICLVAPPYPFVALQFRCEVNVHTHL